MGSEMCIRDSLKDSEGTMKTSEVTATFTNGKPRFVKGVVVMKGTDEWDRFMRFMDNYAASNDLGFAGGGGDSGGQGSGRSQAV